MPAALLIRGGASESLTSKGASELESGVDDLSMDFLHVGCVGCVVRAGMRGAEKGKGGKKKKKEEKKRAILQIRRSGGTLSHTLGRSHDYSSRKI